MRLIRAFLIFPSELPSILEQFKDYWDWTELSRNTVLPMPFHIIDKYIDLWNWNELINQRYRNDLYSVEFLERYIDRIPTSKLQDSYLWTVLIDQRKNELKKEAIA